MNPQKLGTCETFHVDKYFEEHGSAGHGGKKLANTLMFFEGCPRPLGCIILLKGANGDEMKKVKHVAQYGVFPAYHLALETSFLANEGASLPELPLRSPITIALPDKPYSVERSISTVSGFSVVGGQEHQFSVGGSLTHMQALSGNAIPFGQDTSSSYNKNFLPNNDYKEDDKKSSKEFAAKGLTPPRGMNGIA